GRPFWVQEFAVPGALRRLHDELATTLDLLHRLPEGDCSRHGGELPGSPDPLAVDDEACRRSLVLGLIGHDDADGVLELARPQRAGRDEGREQPGALRVHWPQARHAPALRAAHAEVQSRVAQSGARWRPDPLWQLLPDGLRDLAGLPLGPVLSVHPLGGCGIGHDALDGVVDVDGRVFQAPAPRHGDDRWEGSLRVLDGAMLPGSLGVNPALTIAALSHAACQQFAAECGWTPRMGPPEPPLPRQPLPVATRPAPRPTRVHLVERLVGPVAMADPQGQRPLVLELSVDWSTQPLDALYGRLGSSLQVASGRGRLRLFDRQHWQDQHLRQADEATREAAALLVAELDGELQLFAREPSSGAQRIVRAGWAWLRNRGLRDTFQRVANQGLASLFTQAGGALSAASRAGEVRRLDYRLKIGRLLKPWDGLSADTLRSAPLLGHKRLTYERRANPWKQLSELELHAPWLRAGRLELDLRFLASREKPLLALRAQADQVQALADVASFGAYLLRLLLSIHLWTFRKSDAGALPAPQRAPGPIAGFEPPRISELVVDRDARGADVTIRLTQYRPPERLRERAAALPPLLFIHGYSVSGNTFTHPSLQPSAAGYFLARGREVWVLDLRSSTALPGCSQPWPMERVALVDIPAALLHVRQLSGRRVDVVAHCVGAVMLSMALLADAARVRSGALQLGPEVWMTREHLGRLAAFNGRGDGQPHPVLNRVVLSQKGPLLRYTEQNQLRAWLMQRVRRWLLAEDFQFRMPDSPTLRDELLDRLLASLPYPDADYDRENPLWPCKTTPWVATRHRMDALYGRDFEAAKLSDATLNAIDDLFGPIHLDTVAQTIHFNRFDAVCSQHGRGEYVTRANLRRAWAGIPTLGLHGEHNGLVDPFTQVLLQQAFDAAGLSFRSETLRGFGHQDVFIGRESERAFACIERFLDGPAPPAVDEAPGGFVVCEPWIGPRLALRPGGAPAQIAVMGRPDFGRGSAIWVRRSAAGAPVLRRAVAVQAGRWSFFDPGPAGPGDAWLCVLIYSARQLPPLRAGQARSGWFGQSALGQAPGKVGALWDWWRQAEAAGQLDTFSVPADALERWREDLKKQAPAHSGWRFAFGSCQYPANLIDAEPAGASLARLAHSAAQRDGPALTLLLGDQIYADASAGLADPVRSDERYDQPYERALRFAPMRALLRRCPVAMLLDDHEVSDNFERRPRGRAACGAEDVAFDKLLRRGLRAYRRYQRLDNAPPRRPGAQDWTLRFGGHPFYLLDTRSERHWEQGQRRLLSQRHRQWQWRSLEHWLNRCGDGPKFIATPSLLLPRRRQSAEDPGNWPRSDAWDGAPEDLARLLALVQGRRNIVFLSGDEHHSLLAEATLDDGKQRTRIVSLHASALHAPLPFANGRPQQLALQERFQLGGIDVQVASTPIERGDGFLLVEPLWVNGRWWLDLRFNGRDQSAPWQRRMPLS
ncbi:alkaline phosphatase D family protein, partial [Pseudorhodoferax sp.]|uniref:alkaline phosphatase D family protein n=1 Tax=Pseudorhodoferax sp. TaxID=1993553 RepID=UPI002DD63CEC